jgi:hypothetical protein
MVQGDVVQGLRHGARKARSIRTLAIGDVISLAQILTYLRRLRR